MEIRTFGTHETFRERAEAWLLKREAEHNLMLGLLSAIGEGRYDTVLLATIERDDEVVGCAVRTAPWPLLVTRAPAAGLAALAETLAPLYPDLRGVTGPASSCDVFQDEWCWRTGTESSTRMTQGIYRVTRVIPPSRPAPGAMRVMEPDDLDLVAEWIEAFTAETGVLSAEAALDQAKRRLEKGAQYLWEVDGDAVSMAGFGGPTPNGIRVNAVYTPPESRGRGYATTLVAALTQKLLDDGRTFCFLYTDMANPTSNAIYRAIGYEPVADSVMLDFTPTSCPSDRDPVSDQ